MKVFTILSGIMNTSSTRHENYLGSNAVIRNLFVVFITVLVWTMEAFLILSLRVSPLSSPLSVWIYSLPAFHLLPWAAGMQVLIKTKRAVTARRICPPSANLIYSTVLVLLVASYLALGSAETIPMLIYRR
jgi:hypothetical protein